jgi:cell division protein FtsL
MSNRRRTNENLGSFGVFVIAIAAIIMVSGGVFFAYLKNRQIETAREIENVEDRIAKHEMDIKTAEMRVDQLTNRYAIRDQLRQNGSSLTAIPANAVESVVPDSAAPSAVALAQP